MFRRYMEDSWYALFVMTGKEDKVKKWLEISFPEGYRFLVPKRKLRERKDGSWHENLRVLFPGYVMLKGQVTVEMYYRMKQTPDFIKLLRSDLDLLEIDPREMDVLGKLISNGEVIGYSEVLLENDQVQVLDGPLTGLEGNIVSVDRRKGRARVRVSFMGELRTMDIGITLLRKE